MQIRWIYGLCALVFLLPSLAHADEKDCKICFSGYAEGEFNFLDTGNSRAFSTRDSYGSTYPTKETVSGDDRKPFAWKSSASVQVTHRYAELWFSPYGDWSNFGWPKSVGLRYSLLARLAYARMKVGVYHHSAHNMVEERYGKGTSTTGFYAISTVVRDKNWSADVWGLYNFHDDNESPYVFTSRAKEMPKEELGHMRWAFGYWIRAREGNYEFELPIAATATSEKFASLRVRSQMFYKLVPLDSRIELGPFMEYRRNLTKEEKFGRDEWLLGAVLRVDI